MPSEMNEKTPALVNLEKITSRRDNIYKLIDNIVYFKNNTNSYHVSEERVLTLKKLKQENVNTVERLNKRNKDLLKSIAKIDLQKPQFRGYLTGVQDIKNTNVFLDPNIKVTKIIGYYGNMQVDSIELHKSDGSIETLGKQYNNSRKIVHPLQDNVFLISIQKIGSTTTNSGIIGNAIIFYFSNNSRLVVKGYEFEIDETSFKEDKVFVVNPKYLTWQDHKRHAKKLSEIYEREHDYKVDFTLASITSLNENNTVLELLRENNIRIAWLGGKRNRRNKNKWSWEDGSSWDNNTSYRNWNRGEPNNSGNKENHLMIYRSGRWNDLWGANKLPAIYSAKMKRYTSNTVNSSIYKSITSINDVQDLEIETEKQYVEDTDTIETLDELKNGIDDLISELDGNQVDARNEYDINIELISNINKAIRMYDDEIKMITNLNNSVTEDFSNMGGIFTNFFYNMKNKINNIFYNNNMKEGFKEGNRQLDYDAPFYDYIYRALTNLGNSLNQELSATDTIEYEENRNFLLELMAQKDSILGNVLMDYMINDSEGSNVEKIYSKLKQENNDKKRKIKINNYNSKAYIEYSYILKVIIFLIALMMPFIILTKYNILEKNISLTAIIIILFLGFLYVFYRLYLLYMKDNINFDKDRIPYDRQVEKLKREGKLKHKTGIRGLGITCVGEECCTGNMVYDSTKNKCFETSGNVMGFANLFNDDVPVETFQNYTIIEPFGNGNVVTVDDFITKSLENTKRDASFKKK